MRDYILPAVIFAVLLLFSLGMYSLSSYLAERSWNVTDGWHARLLAGSYVFTIPLFIFQSIRISAIFLPRVDDKNASEGNFPGIILMAALVFALLGGLLSFYYAARNFAPLSVWVSWLGGTLMITGIIISMSASAGLYHKLGGFLAVIIAIGGVGASCALQYHIHPLLR